MSQLTDLFTSLRLPTMPEVAHELIRTLGYPKFALTAAERDELLADYLPYCSVVTIPPKPLAVPRGRDPFDVPFLHLAAHGKADYLVTGDRDLLALQGQLRCAIVTAEAFQSALDLH